MIEWLSGLLCLWLGICGQQGASGTCRDVVHDSNKHVVCSYRLAQVSVEMFHSDKNKKPYGSLAPLKRQLDRTPLMLANGGMYHENLAPVGLYIERGRQFVGASTKGGWGNFHLLPNGVFWIDGDRAGVSETKAFLRRSIKVAHGVDYATQSGPMLVIDGKLHPRFLKDSTSKKIRNGVGVSADGQWVHFAQSRGLVTFWSFGTLFRDVLETPNALFLDGSISTMEAGDYRLGGWRPLGPIIGVFAR
ncbi:phosphodiester glycosidase family protein [Pseudahrensia aquimaris]|uniref:Phosphodiester glycosidase family protein n=1 Tax=Pseudahrensia aquimaris TaxID=744461 RepID=A0ABW3FKL0_9HYPH